MAYYVCEVSIVEQSPTTYHMKHVHMPAKRKNAYKAAGIRAFLALTQNTRWEVDSTTLHMTTMQINGVTRGLISGKHNGIIYGCVDVYWFESLNDVPAGLYWGKLIDA